MTTLYKVTGNGIPPDGKPVRWGGSMAQVREHKKAMAEEFPCLKPRTDITVEEVEFQTGKAGLLDALNTHATKG